jgi:tetratricopeptide (TPR) repeat protein
MPEQEEIQNGVEPNEPPVQAESKSGSSRPSGFLLVVAFIALAPAGIIYIAMSRQADSRQSAMIADFRQSLERMEANLTRLRNGQDDTHAVIQSSGGVPTYLTLLSEGNISYREGDLAGAVRAYKAAIALDTGGTMQDEAHYRLAMCVLSQDADDAALQEFLTVVRLHPGGGYFGRSCVGAARILKARGQFSQSRRFLYMVLGAGERLRGDDRVALEQAYFALPECYELEAASIEESRSVAVQTLNVQPMEAIQ